MTTPRDKKIKKIKRGDSVVLTEASPELLRGLPREDQKAISDQVGKTLVLVGYDDEGRAELKFTDGDGAIHFGFVSPKVIRPVK
jgi:hypothetical protein